MREPEESPAERITQSESHRANQQSESRLTPACGRFMLKPHLPRSEEIAMDEPPG